MNERARNLHRRRLGTAAAAGFVGLATSVGPIQTARADGIVEEVRLGVLDHDLRAAGGIERGADINAEITFASPVSPTFGASWPQWLRWVGHPRPHIGLDGNTAGATSQGYFGLTWTAVLTRSIVGASDRLEFNYLFGPAFNDGYDSSSPPNRKSLGSHVLFHLGGELAYWVTPATSVGIYFDHSSNAGLATPNDSLNNLGVRVGYRF